MCTHNGIKRKTCWEERIKKQRKLEDNAKKNGYAKRG